MSNSNHDRVSAYIVFDPCENSTDNKYIHIAQLSRHELLRQEAAQTTQKQQPQVIQGKNI